MTNKLEQIAIEDEFSKKIIKIYVNGTFQETIPKYTIVDFPWFVMSYARQVGIKNLELRINGRLTDKEEIQDINLDDVEVIDISTYDVAR